MALRDSPASASHPREIKTARGPIAIYDFGGPADGPLLHFGHANGFNGLTYRSLLRPLTDHCRVIAWDARGHGHTRLPAEPQDMRSWDIYRDDLLALIDALGEPLYLGGHSMGASASLLAAAERPAIVRGLLLVEPVMPTSAMILGLATARLFGLGRRVNPLARTALRRRRCFPSIEAMIETYSGRGAFRAWTPEMIADYVTGGSRAAEGGGVELRCSPEWEAATFLSLPANLHSAILRYEGPLILLYGTLNSTCPAAAIAMIRETKPNIVLRRVDGATHLLPMERPEVVCEAARALTARAAVSS